MSTIPPPTDPPPTDGRISAARPVSLRRRTRSRALVALAVAGALSVAACSSDSSSTENTVPPSVSSTTVPTMRMPSTEIPNTTTTAIETPATTDPTPTDPSPTDPTPTYPSPTDPAPTDPATTAYPAPTAYPAQPVGVPWPTTSWPTGDLPPSVDAATVAAIVDAAFAPTPEGTGQVHALLAVSGGRLVLEQYNGWEPSAPHPSWSMAKSITHAMLGILVADGRLDPAAPAPVPEWSDPADPRHPITIEHLLRMRSGLTWQEEYAGTSDVITVLFGEGRADRGHYAADKPLLVEPDTTFSYSTGTSLILARIIADQVGYGEAGTSWAQQALFDPLGITTVAHDLDDIGVMSGGSNINMSAQDFARFGLLYLRGGQWDGRQLVPQAWVDDAHRALPDAPDYGAHWWVDTDESGEQVSFRADGYAGQVIVVVPSLDLVVVALADVQDGRSDRAADALVEAFAHEP